MRQLALVTLASRLSDRLPAALPTAAVAAVSTAATIFLGFGFVDIESAAVHVAAIDGSDGFVSCGVIGHFDESEAARPAGVTVGNQVDPIHCAELFKHRSNGSVGGVETEVSYKNILHLIFFLKFAEQQTRAG
jgi:hypothetical protein